MKKSKLIKLLTILVILMICLISFVGIYEKQAGQMKNIIPEYQLAMNLSGTRVVELSVDTSTKEVIYDKDGNVTEDGKNEDGTLKEGYTKEDKKVNPEESLTKENYLAVKKVIENRLEHFGVNEYQIRQNNDDGKIVLEIPENTSTDEVISYLNYQGSFTITDSETKEELLNQNDVKEAKAVYGSTNSGTTVYLSIEFNKEGKKKLEEITKKYIKTTDEEGNEVTKKITMAVDGETLIETYFGETIATGILQLSIGSASTSNEEITSYIKQASSIASLIDSGKMPIQYKLDNNTYLASSMNEVTILIMIAVVAGILLIALIYWMIKYKANGIFSSISFVGFIALLLLALRYANVIISLEACIAFMTLLVANYIFLQDTMKQLKNTDEVKEVTVKNIYKKYISLLFPLLIVAVVFTFTEWTSIASIGMIFFWGLLILFVYNYGCIQLLLETRKEENEQGGKKNEKNMAI